MSWLLWLYRTVAAPQRPLKAEVLNTASAQLTVAEASCKRVAGDKLPYCEDLLIWESVGVAIVSSDPARDEFNPFTGEGDASTVEPGRLSVYDLETDDVQHIEIENWPAGKAIHPLGINIKETVPGKEALLAFCNYQQKSASVELLRIKVSDAASQRITAVWLYDFTHPALSSPNAVWIHSEHQVVVTNSYRFSPRKNKLAFQLEQICGYPGGSVLTLTKMSLEPEHVSRTLSQVACSRIALANGLAVAPIDEDSYVAAVAGCTSHDVHIYEFGLTREGLIDKPFEYRYSVPVGFLPDNLHFVLRETRPASNGHGEGIKHYTLVAAGHVSALDFLKTASTKVKKGFISASRVVKFDVDPWKGGSPGVRNEMRRLFGEIGSDVEVVFESPGSFYGTSSTAAPYKTSSGKTNMLICGLWDKGLLKCQDVDVRMHCVQVEKISFHQGARSDAML